MPTPRQFQLVFVGDVMLGRLIDQCFPTHVHEPSEARIVASFKQAHPELRNYTHKHPWGNTLPIFHAADLNLINLETSATTHEKKWPDKVFNYRMHPANIDALKAAHVDYASLANNHTLDFSKEGLIETVKTLKRAGIAFAGAGETREEATKPAILSLPRVSEPDDNSGDSHSIHVYSGSDHPEDWFAVPNFHLIDYSTATRKRLKSMLTEQDYGISPSLKVFSVHWGPNYSWQPAKEIRSLAHFLVDECGIDIIHGHSSHHVQGVEIYKRKLIIYGCGDFVDDYAVKIDYRNDLSAVWRVTVGENTGVETIGGGKLELRRLEILPTRIKHFQAHLLETEDPDHEWLRLKLIRLNKDLRTEVQEDLGPDGQLIIDL